MNVQRFLSIVAGLLLIFAVQTSDAFSQDGTLSGRNELGETRGLGTAIQRLSGDSRQFAKTLDRELDRSRYNGSRYEDNANRKAKSFLKAVDRFERAYRAGARERQLLVYAERMLNQGADLNRIIERNSISPTVDRDWARVHETLLAFARWHRAKGKSS